MKNLLEIVKNRPNIVDKHCLELLKNIIGHYGKLNHYKLYNTSAGLEKLIIKEKWNIVYYEDKHIIYINPTDNDTKIREIECSEENLSKLYCKVKRKGLF